MLHIVPLISPSLFLKEIVIREAEAYLELNVKAYNNRKGFFQYFPEGTQEFCGSAVECWSQWWTAFSKQKFSLFFHLFPDKRSTMAETQAQDCLVENGCIQLLGGLCQDWQELI